MGLSFVFGLAVVAGILALILSGTLWAQTAALKYQAGNAIDYTPASAYTAGNVVVLGTSGTTTLIGIGTRDIEANVVGALEIKGVFKVPKITGTIARGDSVYWDADGTPVTGDASSGAASGTAADGVWMGTAVYAAASGDSYVYVDINSTGAGAVGAAYSPVAVAAAGAAIGNAANLSWGFNLVSAADGTTGVKLPAGIPGRTLIVKNNANAALKVYPPTAGTVNALSANTNYVQAAFAPSLYIAWNASTWYSHPLVAS